MTGTRPRDLAPPAPPERIGRRIGFGCHDVLPVLPVAIPDEHRDWGAQRLAGAHAGEPFDAIGLDLHPGAAAVAALAALQLGVHVGGGQRQAGRDPLEDTHEPSAVRFACRCEPECHVFLQILHHPPPTSTTLLPIADKPDLLRRARRVHHPGPKAPGITDSPPLAAPGTGS